MTPQRRAGRITQLQYFLRMRVPSLSGRARRTPENAVSTHSGEREVFPSPHRRRASDAEEAGHVRRVGPPVPKTRNSVNGGRECSEAPSHMGACPRLRYPTENGPKDAGKLRHPLLESLHTARGRAFLLSPALLRLAGRASSLFQRRSTPRLRRRLLVALQAREDGFQGLSAPVLLVSLPYYAAQRFGG
jgi:hypothetical protein